MIKRYSVLFLAGVLLLLLFLTQWTYIEGAMPLGMALLKGQFNWMGIVLLAAPVAAVVLVIIEQHKWLPLVGIVGLAPFAYFVGNIIWSSFQLSAEGNFLVRGDPFFMFRFFSYWLWVHLGVSILFAIACFLARRDEEDYDEDDGLEAA